MYTNPLVSIIIITYNSSKYVIETLESAQAQTYQNIELIISDDCSTDNTVEICREWIDKNKSRFVRTELVTVPKNTGIAPNCNRGVKASRGEWIKYFAGDDLLLPDCITDYVNYINKNPDCFVLFGRIKTMINGVVSERKDINKVFSTPHRKQYRCILRNAGIPAQAAFYSRFAYEIVGGFNENYKYCEDFLMYTVLADYGFKFHFINKLIAIYRRHESNISGGSESKVFVNKNFFYDSEKVLFNEIVPRLLKERIYINIFHFLNYSLMNRLIILLGNKRNLLSKMISFMYIAGTYGSFKRFFYRLMNYDKK
jgi:glycosyltransferase involved in cell wall biosynthesis